MIGRENILAGMSNTMSESKLVSNETIGDGDSIFAS